MSAERAPLPPMAPIQNNWGLIENGRYAFRSPPGLIRIDSSCSAAKMVADLKCDGSEESLKLL